MKFKSVFMLILIFPIYLNANCNFRSSEHIQDLKNPNFIKEIKVSISDSRKWVKDSLKIITDHNQNINPKLRNKHKAKISVFYDFGECEFNAVVRQHGDWKDHISFDRNGNIIASLDVKLKDGNIFNSVHFKLLLPETRNSENEVLGSLILKQLGFITPETFIVKGSINESSSSFLFQESAEKELIERYKRREGPILEGDEGLLWSYKDFDLFELEAISLSRLDNDDWFRKGKSSSKLGIIAISKLQKAYLNYTQDDFKNKSFSIYPNKYDDPLFANYSIALIVLKGTHALRPHNRKYYYNSFEEKFEPIYYDGNLLFSEELEKTNSLKELQLISSIYSQDSFLNKFLHLLQDDKKKQILKSEFISRVDDIDEMKKYFDVNLKIFNKSLIDLINKKKEIIEKNKQHLLPKTKNSFLKTVKSYNLDHLLITNINLDNKDNYNLSFFDIKSQLNYNKNINLKNLSAIISSNSYLKRRAVFVPDNIEIIHSNLYTHNDKISFLGGTIIKSVSTKIQIDRENKKIKIHQSDPLDWILFKDISFEKWSIDFIGSLNLHDQDPLMQRINKFGITGCLTFYNSKFIDTSIKIKNGRCEDSLNVISSDGIIELISIDDAFSDAVDLDFSNILVKKVFINSAGNDCFDVSSGTYEIIIGKFNNCADKGISVGESSNMKVQNISISNSDIGLSVKDSSLLEATSVKAQNVKICIESFKKKQEFDGGNATIYNLSCTGKMINDSHSSIKTF